VSAFWGEKKEEIRLEDLEWEWEAEKEIRPLRLAYQPPLLFSQNKLATNNQPSVFFSQNKSALATSQTKRLIAWMDCAHRIGDGSNEYGRCLGKILS
jgi:hypothetical protein